MVAEYNEQTTALSVVPAQPQTYTEQQLDLIRKTVAAGTSPMEFDLFVEVVKRTGLDPFAKQVYAIKRGDKLTIQTGIDGYRLLAARTGALAGIDDAVYDDEEGEHPNKASVTVWRFAHGQRVPFTATARWREYVQTNRDGNPTSMWAKMPYLMLGKCAEALALRKAFPAELSGVYTAEEMTQADSLPSVPSVPENSDGEFTYTTQAAPREKRVTPAKASMSWADLKARAGALGIDEVNWPLTVQAWTGKAEGYTAQDWKTVRDRLDQRERMEATADLTQMGEMRV